MKNYSNYLKESSIGEMILSRNRKIKIFCIGLNKTGTTSLEKALKDLGFKIGNQRAGENLIEEWAQRNFKPIIKLATTADAFQDVPFSLPYTYQALDQHFPNAKFLLSLRNSPEEWYQSLTRFHSKLWADGKRIPTSEDLKKGHYIYQGRPFRANRLIYNTPESTPYEKDFILAFYERHIINVREYFRHRPGKLLEVNVGKQEDYFRLCEFLQKRPVGDNFPWLNQT